MSEKNDQQVCFTCGKTHQNFKRIDLGVFCTEEELSSMKLLQTKNNCAQQALMMIANTKKPEGSSQEDTATFIQNTLEYQAVNQWMLNEWWSDIAKKYNFKEIANGKNIFVDFDTKEFFYNEIIEDNI